jgi:hypothetical protein
MSRLQKVQKLSGELYSLVETLNTAVDDGDYNEGLLLIRETYTLLSNLEEKLEDLYESCFC